MLNAPGAVIDGTKKKKSQGAVRYANITVGKELMRNI